MNKLWEGVIGVLLIPIFGFTFVGAILLVILGVPYLCLLTTTVVFGDEDYLVLGTMIFVMGFGILLVLITRAKVAITTLWKRTK